MRIFNIMTYILHGATDSNQDNLKVKEILKDSSILKK
jgi:hypothetical protein